MEQKRLQKYIDDNLDKIEGVYPTGILGKDGKWLIICPTLYTFKLKFDKPIKTKVKKEKIFEESVEEDKPVKCVGTYEDIDKDGNMIGFKPIVEELEKPKKKKKVKKIEE